MLGINYHYFVRPQKCNWALFDKCCNMNVKTSELFRLRHILLFWGRGFCGCCHVGVQATVQNVNSGIFTYCRNKSWVPGDYYRISQDILIDRSM